MSVPIPDEAHDNPPTEANQEVFRAVVVTNELSQVLLALTQEAFAHFGRGELYAARFSVAVVDPGPSFLASADFAIEPL